MIYWRFPVFSEVSSFHHRTEEIKSQGVWTTTCNKGSSWMDCEAGPQRLSHHDFQWLSIRITYVWLGCFQFQETSKSSHFLGVFKVTCYFPNRKPIIWGIYRAYVWIFWDPFLRKSKILGGKSNFYFYWWENMKCGDHVSRVPSGKHTKSIQKPLKMAIEKNMDLPIQNVDFPVRYVNVYQRVILILSMPDNFQSSNTLFSIFGLD